MTKKTALHIISSARGNGSYSRALSSAIINKLISSQEIDTVVERDLTKETPPFIKEDLVGAFYTNPGSVEQQQLLKYADTVVSDVSNADIIVIGTPMYNLGMSAVLKAWIDQLVRYGVTYGYDGDGVRSGLLNGKKIYLAIASGGRLADWPNGHEFIASHIEAVIRAYVGLAEIHTFRVEGTVMPGFEPDYQKILAHL
ncbi:MAG: NAD(P)H-dependent oxidoreductase [Chitinophaga sp.]|uniref:FMN-dependent NADH-azoreductase n=1 Tax=Chitinophaga sp. TaxID=1869181 RepID=UPI001B0B393E|nr:NAD(P)H-dependent oxidoreductase [Chitinophaga sp.]MBO9728556.1 NAD(P)H-dependent oxidoreductase [Chitinophaga sp.]